MKYIKLLLVTLTISSVVHAADYTINVKPGPNSVGDAEVSEISSSKVSDFLSSVTSIVNSLIGASTSSSGGAAVNPSYVEANSENILSTNTSTVDHNAWKDVTGATLTITPTGANEKWEIYARGSIGVYYGGGSSSTGKAAILRIATDTGTNSGDLVDNASALVLRTGGDPYAGTYDIISSVTLIARVTLSSAQSYKLQIKHRNDAGVNNSSINSIFFGTNSLYDTPQFWAKRVY